MILARRKGEPARGRSQRRTVAVVTGTRAEFGLLRPVMDAITRHPGLRLRVIAGGAHLLPPARTIREVERAYDIAARVPMQKPGHTGRHADAVALGRGVSGFAHAFATIKPDWVVVLGDRIEALAAASAASVAGIAVCHIHGGDRAEGIADEAMRHAITKLAHLHCAATKTSAARIVRLGEPPARVHVTGSPAIDGLSSIPAMSGAEAAGLGDPRAVILLHPSGLPADQERAWAFKALTCARELVDPVWNPPRAPMFEHVLILSPNADPGREAITEVWTWAASLGARVEQHLSRERFVGLLRRIAQQGGALLGNSSAGLIEAAAIGVAVVNFGPRQAGREQGRHVLTIPAIVERNGPAERRAIANLLRRVARDTGRAKHPYGDGRAGERIANLLARTDPHDRGLLRKRNTY